MKRQADDTEALVYAYGCGALWDRLVEIDREYDARILAGACRDDATLAAQQPEHQITRSKSMTTIRTEAISIALADLIELRAAVENATTVYREAIDAVAKASGAEASVLRKLVTARVADEERARKLERDARQLALLFDEVTS